VSNPEYFWVVVGEVSRLPVYVSDKKHRAFWWLDRRRGTSLVRLFRINGDRVVEICLPCFMDNPDTPAKPRGHK
jgi:hypothetical protein